MTTFKRWDYHINEGLPGVLGNKGTRLLGNKGYLKITFREQGNIDYLDF